MSEAGMKIPPPPQPKVLLQEAGLDPKKSWGQNFLLDQEVLNHMAQCVVQLGAHTALELGAGLGALTYHLLKQQQPTVAIERDREMAQILRTLFPWSQVFTLCEADAATLDYAWYAQKYGQGASLAVAGNLPYHISSRILVSLAGFAGVLKGAVVLVQKEVAERLAAGHGSRTYGLLSVLVQRAFEVSVVRGVPPSVFLPQPKVHSAVVVLRTRSTLLDPALDACFVRAAKAAFCARRKTLKNAWMQGLHVTAEKAQSLIEEAGLNPQIRAEMLDVKAFERLACVLQRAESDAG
jgi:16S rRNA (adenine1518-N6/adenine1519-N6)-dimethyltransferase